MEDDNGNTLTDLEARKEIAKLQAMGHKLICCSSNCKGFDPFGGGCTYKCDPYCVCTTRISILKKIVFARIQTNQWKLGPVGYLLKMFSYMWKWNQNSITAIPPSARATFLLRIRA